MSSTRGVRWLMWVDGTPPMSAATAEIRSSAKYQSWSTGSVDSSNAAVARSRKRSRVGGAESVLVGRPVGQLQQLGPEEGPGTDELLQPRLRLRVEEAPVGGDQHRGEHPERVLRQLVGVDRAEGGGDHRYRALRRVPQVVEADRVHPEAGEHPRGLGQFARRADPDRAVPLRGHPVDAAQPLGVGTVRSDERRRSPPGRRRRGCCRRAPRSRTGSARRRANSARRSASARVRRVSDESARWSRSGCCLSWEEWRRGRTQMMWTSVSSAPVPNRSALNAVGSMNGSRSR